MTLKTICCIVGLFAASGASLSAGAGVTAPNAGEVRTLNERIPAGGTVQVKYLLTQPRPITTGGPSIMDYGFAINGVAAFSPQGDTAGAAVWKESNLSVSVVSPNSDYGTNLDYPFLTVTMTVLPTAVKGSTYALGFTDANYQGPSGPLTLTDSKPGTLTVGGSVSVSGVFPGGGTWGPGTVISVRGTGFSVSTKVTTRMKTTAPSFVSSSEMRFTLNETTTMDTQPITAQNPDGSQSTFYSYLRGTPLYAPSRELLTRTDPIFQALTHGVATVGPIASLTSGQFLALAIQNPTPGPVVVSFTHARLGISTTITLQSCTRVMDELSSLLGGLPLAAGDQVTVTATSGVQIVGLQGDESAGTVIPFLPQF